MRVKAALEEEIAFWQSLIDRQSENTPQPVIERMKQARMLAEQKLWLLAAQPQEMPSRNRSS